MGQMGDLLGKVRGLVGLGDRAGSGAGVGDVAPPPKVADTSGRYRWRLEDCKWAGQRSWASTRWATDTRIVAVGANGLRTAEEMRCTDAQVQAVLNMIGLPIRSTNWYVEPPTDPSPSEREATELLQDDLMGGMDKSFDDVLRDVLRAVFFGYSLSEVEWEIRDGRAALKDVRSLNMQWVQNWTYGPDGDLTGVVLYGTTIKGKNGYDPSPTPEYKHITIPLYRLIHAPYEAENESPTGRGLWRPMYPHWHQKQYLYRLTGMAIERSALGVPYAKMPDGSLPSDRDEMLQMLQWLRSADDAAMVLPPGAEIGWFEAKRDLMEVLPLIQHHDALMARAALTQFLNLGQTQTGSHALAAEHVRMFLEAEDAIARWIGGVLTRQVARRWTEMNYPGLDKSRAEQGVGCRVKGVGTGIVVGDTAASGLRSGRGNVSPARTRYVRCPRIRHRAIRQQSLEGIGNALLALTQGGFITPTAADEEHLRALAELPAVPKEQLGKRM